MIPALLLACCAVPCPSHAPSELGRIESARALAQDPALDEKIAQAGADVAKLLELASTCAGAGQAADARKVRLRILELDPDNGDVRAALGHQRHDGKWFETYSELAAYKRAEEASMKEKGLVRWREEWVPEADLPFIKMRWVKGEDGSWAHPLDVARAKEVAELAQKGHQFRRDDCSWVAPEDFEHWTALRWKCGEAWVDLEQANGYHSKPQTPWELDGDHFVVLTTCNWEGGNSARWYADRAFPELVRLFGIQPASKPRFVVWNSLEQYNQGALGSLLDSEGISSLHGAYFADLAFEESVIPPRFRGTGVSFWDRGSETLRPWGPFWLRWAAAQSFVEAIDPSWKYVGDRVASLGGAGAAPSPAEFWREKRIPRWLRYGAASYVERFMRDPEAAPDANPWGLRDFAIANVRESGGLRKLEEIFAFALDVSNQSERSTRLYHEAGLVVAYLLDGDEGEGAGSEGAEARKSLRARHVAFQSALKLGSAKDVAEAALALQKELLAQEGRLRAFAGL